MERSRTQPNVLFVDDDQEHLQSIAALMREQATHWRVECLSSPEEALELMQRRTIDVIISDLSMPDMDGVELLDRARKLQPHAVRIVLSGEGDESSLLRAIPFAHQWLAKPVEPAVLFTAIDNAITSGTFVHRDDLRAILGNSQALPSIPSLFAEVAKLIADPEVDIGRTTAVVERDPGMAAKVLQMANCAFYRPERPLASIREAVMRIGLRTLANCVLAAELFYSMPRDDRQTAILIDGIEYRARMQSTLLTTWCDRAIDLPPDVREMMPTAGLLHEVGALVLLQFDPLTHRTSHRLAQRHKLSLEALERRLIGASHAHIAASILGTWGLPWPLVDIIAHHHEPDRCYARTDMCSMLAAAEVFVTTPWLVDDFRAHAEKNGWGEVFAQWEQCARDVLAKK